MEHDQDGTEMTTFAFHVKYDGDAVREHSMDVHELAPAMLALGDLCREANTQINGENANVNLLVKANIEDGSFDIEFEFLQTLLSQMQTYIGSKDVKTAKDILEWLGIIGSPTAVGLFALLKWRRFHPLA